MNAPYGHSGTERTFELPWFDAEVSDRVAHELAYDQTTGDVFWDRLFAAGAVAYAEEYSKSFDERSIAEGTCGEEAWSRLTPAERTRVATENAFEHFVADLDLTSFGFAERSGFSAR